MKLLKVKQPQKGAPEVKGPSLAERIRALQAEAEALIEKEAQAIKSTQAGAGLPIDWIRMDVRHRMKGGACNCKCALNIIEKDNNERR